MRDRTIAMPLHFLVPRACHDRLANATIDDLSRDWSHFVMNGEHAWACQSYVILRHFGFDARLDLPRNRTSLVFAHYTRLNQMHWLGDSYIVCLRADYPKSPIANFHIVQNPRQESPRAAYIPHWPMPAVMPRNPTRKDVCTVGLMGIPWQQADMIPLWKDSILSRGLLLRIIGADGRWNDFSDIDILVAIRSFDDSTHDTKPPWKLLTAWTARIPLIAGRDSAYQHIGIPGKNYLVATSLDDALDAIDRLCNSPQLYNAIVQAGLEEVKNYQLVHIIDRWQFILTTRILPDYTKWLADRFYRHFSIVKRHLFFLPGFKIMRLFKNRRQHNRKGIMGK